MSNTSIGPGEFQGGNENHDGDPRNTTLGEKGPAEEPPARAELVGEAAPDVPAGVPGSPPKPGVSKGGRAYPDGPNVESSPWELEAARGKKPGR